MVSEGHGYGLEVADIEWFNLQWVPDRSMWTDPTVSPLFARDLAGLPPTWIVTCEHDPLRDQGEHYARLLADAGVRTVLRREPRMVHNHALGSHLSGMCSGADRVAVDVAEALK